MNSCTLSQTCIAYDMVKSTSAQLIYTIGPFTYFYSGYNRKFQITYANIIGIQPTIAHGTHELLKTFIHKTWPRNIPAMATE